MTDIVIQFKNGKTISFIEEGNIWNKIIEIKNKKNTTSKSTITFLDIWFIDCEEIVCMWRKGA